MRKRNYNAIYRSGFEQEIAAQLKLDGVDYEYETEKFVYVKEHTYKPDFIFHNTRIIVEAKGYFLPADRAKSLLVRPIMEAEGWELRFVFANARNRLNARSSTTYADWCDKHGFVWAQGRIPEEWTK